MSLSFYLTYLLIPQGVSLAATLLAEGEAAADTVHSADKFASEAVVLKALENIHRNTQC